GHDQCYADVAGDLYFFVSSRRRHTRSKRDWSSDVCSSDLKAEAGTSCKGEKAQKKETESNNDSCRLRSCISFAYHRYRLWSQGRSEERRVGKECRCGWGREHCEVKEREGRCGVVTGGCVAL